MLHSELLCGSNIGTKRTLFSDDDDTAGARGLLRGSLPLRLDASFLDGGLESTSEIILADAAEVRDLSSRIRVHLSTGHVEGRASSTDDLVFAIPRLSVDRHLLGRREAREASLQGVAVKHFPTIVLDGDVENRVSEVDSVDLFCLCHLVVSRAVPLFRQ